MIDVCTVMDLIDDFFADDERAMLQVVCARIVPQPKSSSHRCRRHDDLKRVAEHRD